jgi:hypothetical protein
MPFSLFVLALYVFLQSAVYLAWFAVDSKLLGYVGILFVLIVVFDGFLFYRDPSHRGWLRRGPQA